MKPKPDDSTKEKWPTGGGGRPKPKQGTRDGMGEITGWWPV